MIQAKLRRSNPVVDSTLHAQAESLVVWPGCSRQSSVRQFACSVLCEPSKPPHSVHLAGPVTWLQVPKAGKMLMMMMLLR